MDRKAQLAHSELGVLVECDPSIKSIIVKIDADEQHAYIVEDLDDQTLVIKENMLSMLKARLEDALKETQQPPDDSGSE
ncbi:TFIIH complex subunit tfb5 [Clarireedia jacksonii]